MATFDPAKWTDDQLDALERKMRREYEQAAREMRAKQEKALAKYARELEAREKALDGTKEAMEAHKRWLASQAAGQEWLRKMVDQLAHAAHDANQRAMDMLNGALPHIYAENANMAAFQVDRALRADTGFTLVNEDAVRHLMGGGVEGQVIHEVTLTPEADRLAKGLQSIRKDVDSAKDIRWNRQQFTSAITQGILQGESVPNIVKRTTGIFGKNRAAATRAARTACTSAENGGRMSSFARAKRLGIDMEIEWRATHDERTRMSHRELDGERIQLGDTFSNGLEYPGDPSGDPGEVYNCRCRANGRVVGFDGKRGSWADDAVSEQWARLPQGMTYEQWKAGKPVSRAESYENPWYRVSGGWMQNGAADAATGAAYATPERIAELEAAAARLDDEVRQLGRDASPFIPSEKTLKEAEKYRDGAAARMRENEWASGFDADALRAESNAIYDRLSEVDKRFFEMSRHDAGYLELKAEHDRLWALCDDIDRKIDAQRAYQRAKRAFDDYQEQVERIARERAEGIAKRDAAQAALREKVLERNRAYGALSDAQPFAPHVRKALGDEYADGMERMVAAAEQRHPEIASAYRRFSSQLRVEESELKKGAYYSGRDRGVHFNAERAAKGDDVHAPHQTTFHEFGHLIDHYSGSGYTYTSAMGELDEAIKKDWTAYRNAAGKRLGVTRNKNQAAIQELVAEGAKRDHLKYGSLSDIIEGCTGESYPLGVGHGASYHKRTPGATAREFFAEVLDGAMACEESYQQLARVFPNAVRMVEEMVREICR